MNRTDILTAPNRTLDDWTANQVMGWFLSPDCKRWVKNGQPVFWVRKHFHPTANMQQALNVINHLREVRKWDWEISTVLPLHSTYTVTVHYFKLDGTPQVAICSNDSLPYAIVVACLLAVAGGVTP